MNRTAVLLISFLLLAVTESSGQISVNLNARNRNTGELVTINTVARPAGRLVVLTAPDPETGQASIIGFTDLRKYEFLPGNIESLWQLKLLESKVYEGLLAYGYHYDRRYEMEEKMKEFMTSAEQSGSFYIDSYLESRLYGILRMVYPVRNTDMRPGILSLKILSDITPDAWVGPDGTLVITTGMITAVHSEVELMALMAQEVAHFALDHHMNNFNNALLNGLEHALGNVIRYSSQQEIQADKCAVAVLEAYGEKPAILASMLRKVIAYGELMGNYYIVSTNGFFPDAISRAATSSDTLLCFSPEYEKLIAPVISYNAFSAYNQSHYLLCRRLIERNISSGQVSDDDLVLLSQAMMKLSGYDEEDEKALTVVRLVTRKKDTAPPEAFKQEAILLLRLGRRSEAETVMDSCEAALVREEQKYRSMPGDWSEMLRYLASEKEWISKTRTR